MLVHVCVTVRSTRICLFLNTSIRVSSLSCSILFLLQILIGRGPYAEQQRRTKDDSKYGSVPARDYDYSEAEHPTPSYRTLPSDVPKKSFFSHSGQTPERRRCAQ